MGKFFDLKFIVFCLMVFCCGCSKKSIDDSTPTPTIANVENKVSKVACVGTSITFGSGIVDSVRYPITLQKLLGNQFQVSNFGTRGSTILVEGDLPYWGSSPYSDAMASKPDILVMEFGTNDSKSMNWQYGKHFVRDYVQFINNFKAINSKMQLFICKPIPAYNTTGDINGVIVDKEILSKVDSVAIMTNCQVIDLNNVLKAKEYLYQKDLIHPNADGAKAIANAIFRSIVK